MTQFKLVAPGIIRKEGGGDFQDVDAGNKDWEEYKAWRAAGNTPDGPDPVFTPAPVATLEERVARLELLVSQLVDTGK